MIFMSAETERSASNHQQSFPFKVSTYEVHQEAQ